MDWLLNNVINKIIRNLYEIIRIYAHHYVGSSSISVSSISGHGHLISLDGGRNFGFSGIVKQI